MLETNLPGLPHLDGRSAYAGRVREQMRLLSIDLDSAGDLTARRALLLRLAATMVVGLEDLEMAAAARKKFDPLGFGLFATGVERLRDVLRDLREAK